jgi:hypothetical protein
MPPALQRVPTDNRNLELRPAMEFRVARAIFSIELGITFALRGEKAFVPKDSECALASRDRLYRGYIRGRYHPIPHPIR